MAGGIPEGERADLLALARAAIRTFLHERRELVRGKDFQPIAPEARGAFVSLHTAGGELRGCIGTILPAGPLDETVARMAVAAAVEDPRFPPVQEQELPGLRIEISSLTVPEKVPDLQAIEIGRHGLIVSQGRRKGLLLPQVAPEWGWDRLELLEHTCRKAGLPPDGWKSPDTTVEWFEAEVWGEGS